MSCLRMSGFRVFLVLSIATRIWSVGTPAIVAADPDGLRSKQQLHDKARLLARELVSGVLDVQLRQLRENGLDKQPVFGDIQGMRAHVDNLLNDQMQDVVELLVSAQQGSREERLENFNAARDKTREVVVQLMAERQKLYRRLQIARVTAQVQQLIAMESKVYSTTRQLPEQAKEQREARLVLALGDQRDVGALYTTLVDTLHDLTHWSGAVAAGASDGLRILKVGRVDEELDNVLGQLEQSRFDTALQSEMAVIKGLRALLEKLEEARGLLSSDREAAIKLVQAMMKKQEELRDQTRRTDLKDATAPELVARQEEVHRELGDLAAVLARYPTAEPLAEQAKESAIAASNELFEHDKPQALQEQGKVLGSLAQIEEQLRRAAISDQASKSADQLSAEVAQLQQLHQDLGAALRTQEQATNQAEKAAQAAQTAGAASTAEQAAALAAARQLEQQVADQLAKTDAMNDLPAVIESRIEDAKESVAAAKQAIDDSQAAPPTQAAAGEKAEDSIRQAMAEVASQLADTQRRQLAVKVGELARGAEALERAAAAERDVASKAAQGTEAGLPQPELQQMLEENDDVATVAAKINEGVAVTTPEVAKMLAGTKGLLEQVGQDLAQAGEKQKAADASKDSAAAQASREALARTAPQAGKAAEQLADAAAALRQASGEAAAELARLAGEQLAQVTQAREAVEELMSERPASQADMAARIAAARDKVEQARIEQLRASGRPAAAEARQTSRAIQRAMEQQQAADRALRDFQQGKSDTAVQAASEQQKVAEALSNIAADRNDDLGDSLRQAAKAAAQAAKETLNGSPARSDAARQQSQAAAAAAQRKADQQAAAESAKAPERAPDASAQQRVGDRVAEASQLTRNTVPEAQAALATAAERAGQANAMLQSPQPENAQATQEQAAQALGEAAAQLAQAAAQLAAEQSRQLTEQARQLASLTPTISNVDAGATAALRQAERAAEQGAQRNPPTASPADTAATPVAPNSEKPNVAPDGNRPAGDAQAEVTRAEERAEASLAARESQLRRDRDIAEALARLAQEQQLARDQIQDAVQELTAAQSDAAAADSQPAPPGKSSDPHGTNKAKQLAAAKKLQENAQRFAEAQRATGQGAAEVSGQKEVANQPIREGLETASQLGADSIPLPPGSEGETSSSGKPMPLAQPTPMPLAPTDAAPNANNSSNGAPSESGDRSSDAGQNSGDGSNPHGSPDPQSRELGTGLVPNAPEVTADQIAGENARRRAEMALDQAAASRSQRASESGTPDSAQQSSSNNQPSSEGQSTANTNAGNASKGGTEQRNEKPEEQPPQLNPTPKGDSRGGDESGAGKEGDQRNFDKEPWFAKLPASLRNAIQARSRGKAPRGYEERLKRYFESID
ncbi:MAG: hypothetical protein FJ295_06940 [Planctomycetes bacterium]|nr:hypothetical protein [Planctomycetota bacterium]